MATSASLKTARWRLGRLRARAQESQASTGEVNRRIRELEEEIEQLGKISKKTVESYMDSPDMAVHAVSRVAAVIIVGEGV